MKKIFLKLIFLFIVSNQINAQSNTYTSIEIIAINTSSQAGEGDLYFDVNLSLWYIGLTNGKLKEILPPQTLTYDNLTGTLNISKGNSVIISNTVAVKQIETSYTVTPDDAGTVICVDSTSGTTLTIPDTLPIGFHISIYQIGTGQVTITGSGTRIIKHRLNRYKTAGQDAGVGLICTKGATAHLTGDLSN